MGIPAHRPVTMSYSPYYDQSTTSSSPFSESCSPESSNLSAPSSTAVDDPAVIVGLACRVPGAQNPSGLWDLINEQRDVRRKIPEDRFNVDAFYHPDGTNKGTVSLIFLVLRLTLASYISFLAQRLHLNHPLQPLVGENTPVRTSRPPYIEEPVLLFKLRLSLQSAGRMPTISVSCTC